MQLLPQTTYLDTIMDALIAFAMLSTCTRSRCGSIITHPGNRELLVSGGYNSQPDEASTDPVKCFKDDLPADFRSDKTCCIHAEQRAIINAIGEDGRHAVNGGTIYFIRIDKYARPMIACDPYCTICSKMALDVGLLYFCLWQKDGWVQYGTKEYNELSFAYKNPG